MNIGTYTPFLAQCFRSAKLHCPASLEAFSSCVVLLGRQATQQNGPAIRDPHVYCHSRIEGCRKFSAESRDPDGEGGPEKVKAEDTAAPFPETSQAKAIPATPEPSRRPQLLIFDEETAASLPWQDESSQPWSAELQAKLTEADRSAKGLPPLQPSTPSTKEAEVKPSFRQPAKMEDLPEELHPRFRSIVRKRPDPQHIPQVWSVLRDADYNGRKAIASGFVPSVDCSISLLIDPRRSDQLIRGTATLPHGSGRAARVAVFTSNPSDAEAATEAGAVAVGGDDLVAQVLEAKGISADVVVATPDMVPRLGKIARILGPKGLMPNPKFGTVTTAVADTVAELRRGKLQFRNDKGGTVSASIGRKSFSDAQLTDNFYALLRAVMDLRPKGLPGNDVTGYVERVSVSTTRGKGFPIRVEDLGVLARGPRAKG